MFRLWLAIGFIAAVFYIYSVVSAALSERYATRGLPKAAWVAVVVIFPVIGGILWFFVGRPTPASVRRRTVAPDDDAEFLASLGHPPTPPADGDQSGRRDG